MCLPLRRVWPVHFHRFLLPILIPLDQIVALTAWFRSTVICLVTSVVYYIVFELFVGCFVVLGMLLRVVMPYTSQAWVVSLSHDEVLHRMIVRQLPRPARPHRRNRLDPLLGRRCFVNMRHRRTCHYARHGLAFQCARRVNEYTGVAVAIVVCLRVIDVEVRTVHCTVH